MNRPAKENWPDGDGSLETHLTQPSPLHPYLRESINWLGSQSMNTHLLEVSLLQTEQWFSPAVGSPCFDDFLGGSPFLTVFA